MRRTAIPLTLAALALAAGLALAEKAEVPETPEVPLGLAPVFWPDDNPSSKDKADLARLLYFAPRLSSDGTVSCASCHEPDKAFSDGRAVSIGIRKQTGGRSAPTVINRAYST